MVDILCDADAEAVALELSDGWTVLAGFEYCDVNRFLGMKNEFLGFVCCLNLKKDNDNQDERISLITNTCSYGVIGVPLERFTIQPWQFRVSRACSRESTGGACLRGRNVRVTSH